VETRKTADSADPDYCHKLFGGCAPAADLNIRTLADELRKPIPFCLTGLASRGVPPDK
jgi:hypothetical protein